MDADSFKFEAAKLEYGIQVELAISYSNPSYIYKPRLYRDGNMWCALYGENLQDGVAGFGSSPDKAYKDFDKSWVKELD